MMDQTAMKIPNFGQTNQIFRSLMFFKKSLAIMAILLFSLSQVFSQIGIDFSEDAEAWADSVYNSLDIEERIGQLIFIRANYSGQDYLKNIPELISKYKLGGVTFFAGDPIKQALKTNEYAKVSKVPLFISIDAEWGLGMRLSNTIKYPLQMTLGAVHNDSLLYSMGRQIAEQCKRIGIHINFAPVIDVNNNPQNPVIGMRSFGDSPESVGQKGFLYMKGMQDGNIIASAKHFPGHGDTKVDSHKDLPIIKKSKKELRTTELKPFEYLIEKGVASIMVAHLSVPAFDKRKNRPATLSSKIIEKQLKGKMGFKGLVISDGLDMKGITKYYKEGEIALEAFKAGNDILLIPDNIPASVNAIRSAIENGKVDEARLEESCKKILKYKFMAGATKRAVIDTSNLLADLNQKEYKLLQKELFNSAITVVRNNRNIIPISFPDTIKPAVIIVGSDKAQPFEEPFSDFTTASIHYLKHDADIGQRQKVITGIQNANLLVVSIINTNISASRKFGITESDIQFIEFLAREKPVILNICASPYTLDFFSDPEIFEGIIVSYQDKPNVQRTSAEIILGMHKADGKLPVNAGGYIAGTGIPTAKTRLSYIDPTDLGIDTSYFSKVDSIALKGIELKAYPGCQVLASKDGYIIYEKSFGYHTYDNKRAVQLTDVYDLASLTKILATTPALMAMVDQVKILLDARLSDYLLYLRSTNKKDLRFREVLAHQSGLTPWIPYYQNTIFDRRWDTLVYRSVISEEFPIRVASNMYIREHYQYDIYTDIIASELGEKEYAYSDLGFYLFKDMIENLTNQSFDKYLYQHFYQPMGLNHLRFKPRKYFTIESIVPTEFDRVFRHQLLTGDVHDQGAAMLGGVSGHAGLFGNAYDVAVVMQMFLNGGNYGGRRFFDQEIVNEFTRCQFPEQENRRGLGFDKPLLEFQEHLANCRDASPSSFGHSGFTGTYTWADPESGLVYVFLSNRVYPDMDNSIIMKEDIRTNIHQLFYESIKGK